MRNIEEIIGEKIKAFRDLVGKSQADVAKDAKSSITTISRLENGHQLPQSENLNLILEAVNRTTEDLFKGPGVFGERVGDMLKSDFIQLLNDKKQSPAETGPRGELDKLIARLPDHALPDAIHRIQMLIDGLPKDNKTPSRHQND